LPRHGKELVIQLGRQDLEIRLGELQAQDQGHESAHEEEEESRHGVHDADALMVYGAQPAHDAGFLFESCGPRQHFRYRCHPSSSLAVSFQRPALA
jgi:hypothetical protein